MSKKNSPKSDPFASREAKKYDNPVASREYILELLSKSSGPLTHLQLCRQLKFKDDNQIEALRRRLIAMVRDGQLISNRKGAYGRIDKMDLVKGRILAHRDGYGFVSPADGGGDIYLSNRQMRKVFDAMLATDEQIEMAEARIKFQPLLNPEELSDEDREKYQKQQEKVQEEGKEERLP